MVINDKHKFVFIHVPKAAGTSVMQALKGLEGNNNSLLAGTKHETLSQFMSNWRGRCDPSQTENPENYFRFAFVRNPWVRMHSFYTYLVEMRPKQEIDTVSSFKDFLIQSCEPNSWINGLHSMRAQYDYFTTVSGTPEMNFVGHYEFLVEDLGAICQQIRANITLPHLNKSSSAKTDYRTVYDEETIEIVGKRFAVDVNAFGYAFDDAKPTKRCSGKLGG